MVRIVVTPTWAKLIDFEETVPTAVEELVARRQSATDECSSSVASEDA
jgi:hypothetical protein